MSEVYGRVTSKHGFYVGDPCYVLADKNYHGVFGGNDYKEGRYIGKTETDEEFSFILAKTAYGDGEYKDEFGNVYCVDTGIIGVVPIELCIDRVSGKPVLEGGQNGIDKLNGLGSYFPGTKCEFEAEDGYFYISFDDKQSIHIVTDEDSGVTCHCCGKAIRKGDKVYKVRGYTHYCCSAECLLYTMVPSAYTDWCSGHYE